MTTADESSASPSPAKSTPGGSADERLLETSLITRLMRRPELGAVAGLIIVTVFFLSVASGTMFELAGIMNFMAPAAQLGILAIGAALLMVGGEFDLSVGSMIAFSGLIFGTALVVWQFPLPLAILVAFVFAGVIGAINGQIVIRTGLPSFIAGSKRHDSMARRATSPKRALPSVRTTRTLATEPSARTTIRSTTSPSIPRRWAQSG